MPAAAWRLPLWFPQNTPDQPDGPARLPLQQKPWGMPDSVLLETTAQPSILKLRGVDPPRDFIERQRRTIPLERPD